MAIYLNFSRALRVKKLLESRGGKRVRECLTGIQFHRSVVKNINFGGSKKAVHAILILSYKPEHRVRIQDGISLANDAERYSLFGGILIVARIFMIGSVIVGLTVAYFVTRFTHEHVFPTILRKSIEFLGPIFIKFGQWASTRKDLFPENICHTLSQLQRTASPHSWIYTKQLLQSIYGSNWNKVFVKFEDESPIGSGCCGQVYKAWVDLNARLEVTQEPQISAFVRIVEYFKLGSLVTYIGKKLNGNDGIERDYMYKRNLQPVAVKVLHPGIKEQLRRDLSIMKGICKCVTYIMPQLKWLSLTDCINEFSQIMENQVFSDNFIHCDLHPGNILVQTNYAPTRKTGAWFWKYIDRNQPRLVILDCGLVVSLNDRCRQNLKDVFRSVLMGDGELAAEYILDHSSHASPDPDGFKRTIKDIVNTHRESRMNMNVSTIVTELFNAMIRYRVKQDGSFSSVILSIAVIEGLGRSLDPNIDIFTEVVPFIFVDTIYSDQI
ncbi:putative aarF domain-containing protein kinase 2 isoform X5 [Megachile rotundata]|uniref:putative aarF domain-containing protein kinase 2 isoform X5 n=1 Tax=Megachile rotundata TaxID=143995 RepID=UPI003FD0CC3E